MVAKNWFAGEQFEFGYNLFRDGRVTGRIVSGSSTSEPKPSYKTGCRPISASHDVCDDFISADEHRIRSLLVV
jgi:hypothetical protein